MSSPHSRFDSRYGAKPVVSLDRGQLVGVGFFAVLSAGLMFALGFAAGRKPLQNVQGGSALRTVDDNHTLHKEVSQQPTQVELTFYHSLLEKEEAKRAAAAPVPAPVAPPIVSAPGPERVAAAPSTLATPAGEGASAQAEKTLDQVAERAVEPSKPEPALASIKPAPPPAHGGAFTVQVGSFKTDAEARGVVMKLEQRGYDGHVVPVSLGNKGTWYRVRVGSFAVESDARAFKARLDRDRFGGWVVKAE